MDVPIERHLIILNNKLTAWQNTYVDAKDDVEIANDIGNKQLEEQAIERMRQALRAVRWIENKITKLEGGDKE